MGHIRQDFIKLINWYQSKVPFEEIEKDGMEEIYFRGMTFFGEVAGNTKYNIIDDLDFLILATLNNKPFSIKELSSVLGVSVPKIVIKTTALIERGYAYSDKTKEGTILFISELGKREYRKELFERENEDEDE